jgi:hypothetical protein
MSKNKYYVFNVSCQLTYSIEATSEKKAREVLEKHGGVDIDGELKVDDCDYKYASLEDIVNE